MRTIYILLCTFLTLGISAQSIEENIHVLYMKADVLMQSERYDEAIRLYNRILREDASFKDAIFMRAKAKYALGAYEGTRGDILQYIDMKGLRKDVIHWMGKTEYHLANYEQARSYFDVAIELDPYSGVLFAQRAETHRALRDLNHACEDWSKAAHLGVRKASERMREFCDISHGEEGHPSQGTDHDEGHTAEESTSRPDIIEIESIPSKPSKDEPPVADGSVDMDATKDIVIDENLTLVIGNGLGTRRVESNPDVFLLSDQSGKVVIDICVSGTGRVTSAEFNRRFSTLFKSSLTSLALRKAKEIEFFPSFREEQCGTVTFMIKA